MFYRIRKDLDEVLSKYYRSLRLGVLIYIIIIKFRIYDVAKAMVYVGLSAQHSKFVIYGYEKRMLVVSSHVMIHINELT